MAYSGLKFKPGINRISTELTSEGGWYDGDKVRFRDGLPQPIGGWQAQTLIGSIEGVCRSKVSWRSNNNLKYEAFGTTQGLFLNSDGTVYDITPIRQAFASQVDPLSITNGTTTLTIAATSHGATLGDRVELSGFDLTSAGIPNAELNNTHYITEIVDSDNVDVELTTSATSTVAGGGGTGTINFLLTPGAEGTVFGNGYGAGAYGVDTYGTERPELVLSERARIWTLDLWGEELVATYRGGTPVKWSPSTDGTGVRASAIPNAPQADLLLVTSPDRHLVLFDTVLPGESEQTKLSVRWCDQEDYTNWTVSATTTAGSRLLSTGSEIVAAIRVSRQVLIWTDASMTAMTFIGPPGTFGFQQLDRVPEIVSRNAAVEVNGTVLWLSLGAFYVFDGVARVLPCPVKDIIFDDYNFDQRELFFGATNQTYQEVWWFYCSANSTEIDKYIMFNYELQEWSYGTLTRTAWEDSGVNDFPTALGVDSTVYDHEFGTSADGSNLSTFIESSAIDIAEGDELMFVRGLVPDVRLTGSGSINMEIRGRRYPHGAETTYGPYTVTSSTERIRTRLRARQIVIRFTSDSATVSWQAGTPRIDVQPQGRY